MSFKEAGKKVKNFFKKFWYLLWKDNSLKGWIFSILFIFIFIKFIFFPGLSLITGTSLPLAIVESCSMYHQGNIFSNYDAWWERHDEKYSELNITKQEFEDFIFKRGFNKGDILFVVGAKPEKLKIGDVIIFNANQQNPVIHRIIKIERKIGGQGNISVLTFSTIGDNNNGQLTFEKTIQENQIVGKAVFKLAPYLGWVKLVFFETQKPVSERGFCKEN
jgi:signal peptidase I